VKDHHQNADHEIDPIGACRCVHSHGRAFVSDYQIQKLLLHHDAPLASVNSFEKVIVNMVFGAEV